MITPPLKPRERDTIIQALSAGVVPRVGLRHVQVGRVGEIGALLRDIDRISEGGSAIRFVIGEYGSGKTFFLNLVRLIALEKRCITIHADLAPDRRIHATGGQARGLYAEAIRSMATRTKPDGGALTSVVERFVTDCVREAEAKSVPVEAVIDGKLAHLQDLTGGYDFASVLKAYWRGSDQNDDALQVASLRWLRGEFTTKTEARQALGVRTIIDDGDIYDGLKLISGLARLAGYAGLFIVFDEMVNLYKLQSAQARNQNYEQILRILNDVLQGSASHIGFALGGTPEFLMDSRRGLYSYQALQSRLAENAFVSEGRVDLSGPVVRLQSLTPEELLVLLANIRSVFASGQTEKLLVPDQALTAFMDHCNQRIGEAYFRTPRSTIKAFVQFLSMLEQYPETQWQELLGGLDVAADRGGIDEASDFDSTEDSGDLASLRL